MKLLEKDNVKFVVMEQVDSLALGKWANDNWAYGKELKWILYRLQIELLGYLNQTVDKESIVRIVSKLQGLNDIVQSLDKMCEEYQKHLKKMEALKNEQM